jgi:hypothetical protein
MRSESTPWRSRLAHHLERPWVHLVVLAAVAVDVAVTMCELSLTDVCPPPPPASADAARLQRWLAAFAMTGRVLLAALLAHQALLMFALGAVAFFARRELVVDLVVVVVAVALEALEAHAEHAGSAHHHKGAGDDAMLLAMLLWRVVRVAHGFFVTAEAEFEGEEKAVEARRLAQEVKRLEDEVEALRAAAAAAAGKGDKAL